MNVSDELASWLTSEEARHVFSAAWLKADRNNEPGSRVQCGLEALVEAAREA